METLKVYVGADDKARLHCPYCGTRRTVDVEKHKNRKGPLKVRCLCQLSYFVFLESRRVPRKETYSQGYYRKLPEHEEWGRIIIKNVSRLGVGFVTLTTHNVKSGDQIKVTLTSDNVNQSDIDKDATVTFVRDKYLGCEFTEPLKFEEALPLHLLTPDK